ncbi:hypothetical protein ABT095_29600 [Kitasatospora sp. NPDC002227]|uniref:hypothetical protein n=1 Tax=Kitasatospora sp. NPDC002227 TaxID=3154773 RepID=UPI0033260ABE
MNILGVSSGQDSPPSVTGGLIVTVAGFLAVALGRFFFKGVVVPGDERQERRDDRFIRRLVGGGFMVGGTIFLGAGLLILVEGVVRAVS